MTLFPIALGGKLRDYDAKRKPAEAEGISNPELSFEQANKALRTMAELTGGIAWFPRRAEEFEGIYRDRKSTRLNSSHIQKSRMPSSA